MSDTEAYVRSQRKLVDNYIPFFFEQRKLQLEKEIETLLPEDPGIEAFDAAAYASRGGNRWRPVFFLATYELIGGDPRLAIESALGEEFLHTASLMLDDSHFQDNMYLRRGQPNARKVYFDKYFEMFHGEETQKVTNDRSWSLFGRKIRNPFRSRDANEVNEESARLAAERRALRKSEQICELAMTHCWNEGRHLITMNALRHGSLHRERKLPGGRSPSAKAVEAEVNEIIRMMIAGQELDLREDKSSYESDASRYWKNRIFSFSFRGPYLLLGARREYKHHLDEIARLAGEVHQMKDDILDLTATEEELGKPVRADGGKSTLAYREGLAGAIRGYMSNRRSILSHIRQIRRDSKLEAVFQYAMPTMDPEVLQAKLKV